MQAGSVPRLGVLGRFSLHLAGDAAPSTLSRSSQRLLAALAVNRGSIHRRQLCQRLWADSDPAHATSNLRSALWRLPRTVAGPLVSSTGQDVALSPVVQVDLWDSERHARLLQADDVSPGPTGTDAVGLLDHDLLPDWSEDWLDIEQESYRQLRLHALEAHSRQQLGCGCYVTALSSALRAVQGDPLRESAHRAVVAVHLAEDNPAQALRQFHAYRRLLARELGLPPSPAIRAMVAHLLGRPLDDVGRRRRGRAQG